MVAPAQNRSSAVMQQRREPADSLDFFPTPPWATRALVEHVLIGRGWLGKHLAEMTAWEPACGAGDMARPLRDYFHTVIASDVHDYGDHQDCVANFLYPEAWPAPLAKFKPDWIITNPPFRLAEPFLRVALAHARVGVALLLRIAILEGVGRYEALYRHVATRPYVVAQFAERVPMFKGRLDPTGSTATAYCWLVWRTDGQRLDIDTRMVWIPPCRKALERDGDYPEAA